MDDILEAARAARADAYAPYSEFPVGAAVQTGDGAVFAGCNVEVANYSNSLHAEEVAVGKAASEGHRRIERVAVSAANAPGLTPCGMCRQTLAEFAAGEVTVLCDEGEDAEPSVYTLETLLPDAMGPAEVGVQR